MRKLIRLSVFVVWLGTMTSLSAVNLDYRTSASGNWSDAANWEVDDGGWKAATVAPDYTEGNISVDHDMTINSDVIADQIAVATLKTLSVASGKTLTIENGGISGGGFAASLSVSGTLDIKGGAVNTTNLSLTYQSGSILKYSTSQTSTNNEFPATIENLIVGANVTLTLNDSKIITGFIQLDGNASLVADDNNITLGQDWYLANGSSFTPGTGTVNLNGNDQLITNNNITFYNLTKTTVSNCTLTICDGITVTVQNELTLAGGDKDNLLTIESLSPSTPFLIDASACSARYLNFLNVKSSQSVSDTLYASNSTDGNNNTNWNFGSNIIYVDKASGNNSNDGRNWGNAKKTLQDTIDNLKDIPTEIWVKKGVYKPNDEDGSDVSKTQHFSMRNNVTVYGGFAGSETQRSERDPMTNHTILSGDLSGNDQWRDNWGTGSTYTDVIDGSSNFSFPEQGWIQHATNITDNVAHVVINDTIDSTVTLDGFIITGGYLVPSVADDGGAGVKNTSSDITISNCTISGNVVNYSADYNYSAGIHFASGNPTIKNCAISANSSLEANTTGVGLSANRSEILISNCTISGNYAVSSTNIYGLGIDISHSTSKAIISNCTIANNICSGASTGGGITVFDTPELTLINSIIYSNSGDEIDAGIDSRYCVIEGYAGSEAGVVSGNPNLDSGGLDDNGGLTRTLALSNDSSSAVDAGNIFYKDGSTIYYVNAGSGTGFTQIGSPDSDYTPSGDQVLLTETTDQRDYIRNGDTDIGAFEYGTGPMNETTQFQTASDGNWSASIWEISFDGGSNWYSTSFTPNSTYGAIAVKHDVAVTADVTIDQTAVESGKTLTVNNAVTLTVANGSGNDLTIQGTVSCDGVLTNNGAVSTEGTFELNNGSASGNAITYQTGSWLKYRTLDRTTSNVEFPVNGVDQVYVDDCTITLNSAKTITDEIFFDNSSGLTLDDNNFTLGGNCSIDGTVDTGTATVTYNGNSGQNVAGYTYHNLVFSGSGTKTLVGNCKVSGDLTIDGLLAPDVFTIELTGESQTIYGDATFYDLTMNTSSKSKDCTLTFEAGCSYTITNELYLANKGDYVLNLRSSQPETQWTIDASATSLRYLCNLDIQDSKAVNKNLYAADSTDSGNNNGWIFERPTYYVDKNGSGNGSSWANANNDLADMLTNCENFPADIWVKAGVYKPNDGNPANTDRTQNFLMQDYVALYGGFSDSHETFSERDPENNQTILSGDLNSDDDWKSDWGSGSSQDVISSGTFTAPSTGWILDSTLVSDNVYNVVRMAAYSDDNAILDGFIITGGVANGASASQRHGGGIYSTNSSEATVKNTVIAGNLATTSGGGIYCNNEMTLDNSTITGNYITSPGAAATFTCYGAGIYGEDLTINDSTISANTVITDIATVTVNGCGIYANNVTVNDSTFDSNEVILDNTNSTLQGGGIYTQNKLTATGCTFSDNTIRCNVSGTGNAQGGGIYCADDQLKLDNSTVSGNLAKSSSGDPIYADGGGIFVKKTNSYTSSVINCTITSNTAEYANEKVDAYAYGGGIQASSSNKFYVVNCLFWNNSAPGYDQLFLPATNSAIYNVIQDYAGAETTNISTDPLLDGDGLKDNGGQTKTIALQNGSSAIDAGVNVFEDSDTTLYYEDPANAGSYKKVSDKSSYSPSAGTAINTPYDQRYYLRDSSVDIGACESDGTEPSEQRYQTVADGIWSNAAIWEVSSDGSNWQAATSAPSYQNGIIKIIHSIEIKSDLTLDQTYIDTNGELTVASGTTLTVHDGTDYNNGDLVLLDGDIVNNGTLTNNGTFTIRDGNITGNTVQYETSSILCYWNSSGNDRTTTNVEFPASGVESVILANYAILTLNGSKTINADLNFKAGNEFRLNNYNLEIKGNGTSYSSYTDYFIPGSGTVTYSGNSSQTLAPLRYHDLVLSGTGTKTLPNYDLYISGDLTNNCAITTGNGAVILNGTNQTINGDMTFYDLQKSGTTADTLTIQAGKTLTVENSLQLNGAENNLLSLRSSQSSTTWNIDASATNQRILYYLDVKDSTSVTETLYAPYSSDSGSNTNWVFNESVVYYVDGTSGNDSNSGKSWDTAKKDLAALLTTLKDMPAEIWVAKGVYKPASKSDSFVLKDYVKLYGGFAGTETSRSERDPEANQTILSGDLNDDDQWVDNWGDSGTQQGPMISNNSYTSPEIDWVSDETTLTDNSYRVVYASQLSDNAVFDGFIIIGARKPVATSGYGMYVYKSDFTVNNCIFLGNRNVGLENYYSTMTLTNCTFIANSGTALNNDGEDVVISKCSFNRNHISAVSNNSCSVDITESDFNDNTSIVTNYTTAAAISNQCPSDTVKLTDCSFNRNTTEGDRTSGGAIFNYELDEMIITRCTFNSNKAKGTTEAYGGAIYSRDTETLTITNSTFVDNSTTGTYAKGGALNLSTDKSVIVNCTFYNNEVSGANSDGGAIYNNYIPEQYIANTIFWDNGSDQIVTKNASQDPKLLNCVFENGYSGTGTNILTTDPKMDPNGLQDNGGLTATVAILEGSSAMDKGVEVYQDSDTNDTVYYKNPETEALLKIEDNSNYTPTSGTTLSGSSDQREKTRHARPDIGAYELGTTYQLTMNVTPPSAGTVTPTAGTHDVVPTMISLTATPDSSNGYEFVVWSISPETSGTFSDKTSSTCDLNLTGHATVKAHFKLKECTISVSCNSSEGQVKWGESGTPSTSVSGTVTYGQYSEKIYAIAESGYSFSQWSNGSTDNPVILTNVTEDKTLTASFSQKQDEVELTMKSFPETGGLVTNNGASTLYTGDSVDITATPASGYQFSHWIADSGISVSDTKSKTTQITINASGTITAFFINQSIQSTLTMVASPESAGTVSPESGSFATGSLISIVATPNDDLSFGKWEVSGEAIISNPLNSSTELTLTGDATVTAYFSSANSVQVTLSIQDNTGGTITPNIGTYLLPVDSIQELKAQATKGYGFSHWEASEGLLIDEPDSASTSFTVISSGSIEAVFAPASEIQDKSQITIRKTNVKKNADFISISRFSSNSFEFNSDSTNLAVKVDDTVFDLSRDNGTFSQKKSCIQYKSTDKTIQFKLDTAKNIWYFKAKRIELSKIDNSDGIDIVLRVDGKPCGENLTLEENISWKYVNKGGSSNFDIHKANGRYCSGKMLKPKGSCISISHGSLPNDFTFNNETDVITISVDNFSKVLDAGSGIKKKDKVIFADKQSKMLLLLDQAKQTWKFKINSLDVNDNLDFSDNLDIILKVNNTDSKQTITPLYKQSLKYKSNH